MAGYPSPGTKEPAGSTHAANEDASQSADTDPQDNPKVVAVRALLQKLSLSQAKSTGGIVQLVGAVAKCAHKTAEKSSDTPSETAVAQIDGKLGVANDRITGFFAKEIAAIWAALTIDEEDGTEFLGLEEIEELVLAYLVALPNFLTESLLWSQMRHLSLGQSLVAPGDRKWDMVKAEEYFRPKLERHQDLARTVASETCANLLARSEQLAGVLFKRMDLDGDGVVGTNDFSSAVLNCLTVEIENVAISAGGETMMQDPDFADDVHMAMGVAMGCAAESLD